MRSSFFFSSRRRHTRFDCDWSSDVCSSDLSDAYHGILRGFPARCAAPRADPGARRLSGRTAKRHYFLVVGHYSHLGRSEEHTSELQSQSNLVCRLLLEKKNKKKKNITTYVS